jgi:hypothetical protein
MGEYVIVGGPRVEKPVECWYEEEDPCERARVIMMTLREIDFRQSTITSGNRRHAEVYASYIPVGFSYSSPVGYSRPQVQATRNVVRSVCDTATALIGKNLPRPRIVTDGGNWDVQQRAQELDKFLVGAYRQGKVYQAAQSAFRDSTIFGTGAYILREHTKPDWHIRAHRILIDDLIIDEQECTEEPHPPNIYLRHLVPLRAAIKKWGKTPEQIDCLVAAAGKTPSAWPGQRNVPKDHVCLVEAWHIDTDGQSYTGMYCDGCELEYKDWPFPWPPIVILYWSPPVSGFYGDGVAYRQFGRQKRINYLYRWVQRCQDLIAVPRVWVDATNGPLRVQISNEIGEIVGVRGGKPEFQTPQAVGQEIYKWLDQLEAGGYEDEGISQLSASNQLPQGIESAPAQREYSFKEGQRFAPVSQRWEDAVAEETAKKLIALYQRHYKNGNSAKVKWSSRTLVQEIPWDEVDLETEQYEIRVEASSLQDLSPSGRLQAAIDLSQTGWIPPEEGRRLLAHPDLERTDQKYNSSIEYAEWASNMCLKGHYVRPCEYGDLQLQQDTAKADYQRAEMKRAPRAILNLLEEFIQECDTIMNPPQPPQAVPGDPNDPMAGAAPMPTDQGLQGMDPGLRNAPAPALSLAAAQGLAPMAGSGQSRRNL